MCCFQYHTPGKQSSRVSIKLWSKPLLFFATTDEERDLDNVPNKGVASNSKKSLKAWKHLYSSFILYYQQRVEQWKYNSEECTIMTSHANWNYLSESNLWLRFRNQIGLYSSEKVNNWIWVGLGLSVVERRREPVDVRNFTAITQSFTQISSRASL